MSKVSLARQQTWLSLWDPSRSPVVKWGSVGGAQDLGLAYEVGVEELESPEAVESLLLVAYLYQALPQLIPRATVEFQCKIAEAQVGPLTDDLCI
jgi:hypothetical protein